jgi:hypothetical protein
LATVLLFISLVTFKYLSNLIYSSPDAVLAASLASIFVSEPSLAAEDASVEAGVSSLDACSPLSIESPDEASLPPSDVPSLGAASSLLALLEDDESAEEASDDAESLLVAESAADEESPLDALPEDESPVDALDALPDDESPLDALPEDESPVDALDELPEDESPVDALEALDVLSEELLSPLSILIRSGKVYSRLS